MPDNAAADIAVAPILPPKGGSGTAPPKKKEERLRFRAFRKRLPFSLYDEDDIEVEYVLVEVDGRGRTELINLMREVSDFKIDENNKPRIMSTKEVEDMNIRIVQFCLRNIDNSTVEDTVLQTWPGSTLHNLAQEVMKLCDLAPDSGDDEKKF